MTGADWITDELVDEYGQATIGLLCHIATEIGHPMKPRPPQAPSVFDRGEPLHDLKEAG